MKVSRFTLLLLILTATALIAGGLIVTANSTGKGSARLAPQERAQAQRKLSRWVLEKTADGAAAEFIVLMAEQADLSAADNLATKEAKSQYVFETLRAHAERTQGSLIGWLKERKAGYQSFYIINAVLVRGDRELALELAARADVASLEGNPQLRGVQPIQAPETQIENLTLAPDAVEPGVINIHAPEVWAAGFTGQGIVIGGQDTGVRWDHATLQRRYRGWNGTTANHNYNWHDSIHPGATGTGGSCGPDSPVPCDDDNHGTHTLGTALGTDEAANQIGVAPGAQFIACRNMDRGDGTPARYLECFEFMLAPYPIGGTPAQGDPSKGAHITTNSWGCPPSEGCQPNTLKAAVEAQRAAGIFTVVAAGNSGSRCETVSDPPSMYDAGYTVGAYNASSGAIASFSSRGPITFDGSNLIKPDIAAPGVSVRSALRTSTTAYGSLSGTSMATPHVAGAVALLWSARPELRGQIALTENLLNESADHVSTADCSSSGSYPNNVWGYGKINVKAALDLAATTLTPVEQAFGQSGGAGSVAVTALTGVAWRALSNASWITITGGASGTGAGTVNFTIAANTVNAPRTGTLTIAGRTVTITQAAAVPLFSVSGRVTIPGPGTGIVRATITFTRVSGVGSVPAPVETNINGTWSQTGFEPGTVYRVTASNRKQAYTPAYYDFDAATDTLNFTLSARGIVIGR